MGPAEDLPAGFVGVPLPMAIPRTRPPPALHTPQEGIFFGSSIGLPRREAPAGSPTEMSEGGPGTRPQPPHSRFPPANIVALRILGAPACSESATRAFLGPAQTDGRGVSSKGQWSRWSAVGVGAPVMAPGGGFIPKLLLNKGIADGVSNYGPISV